MRKKRVWTPDERVSMETALRSYTAGGAYAGYMDEVTGSLEPGKCADFAVLSNNPFEVDPDRLSREVRVEMTFVEGALAYRRDTDPGI